MAFMLAIFLSLLALNASLQKVFARKPATKTEYFVRTLSDVNIWEGETARLQPNVSMHATESTQP